jgi:hypothetical protein
MAAGAARGRIRGSAAISELFDEGDLPLGDTAVAAADGDGGEVGGEFG